MLSGNTKLVVFVGLLVVHKSHNSLFGSKLNGIGEFFTTEIDFIMGKLNGTEFSPKRTLIQRVDFLKILSNQFYNLVKSPLNMENAETKAQSIELMDILRRAFSRLFIDDISLYSVFKLSDDDVRKYHEIHENVNRTLKETDEMLNKIR